MKPAQVSPTPDHSAERRIKGIINSILRDVNFLELRFPQSLRLA